MELAPYVAFEDAVSPCFHMAYVMKMTIYGHFRDVSVTFSTKTRTHRVRRTPQKASVRLGACRHTQDSALQFLPQLHISAFQTGSVNHWQNALPISAKDP